MIRIYAQPEVQYLPPGHGLGALGQQKSGTLDALTLIARAFPSCFSSRSIIPAIDRSTAFARTITTEGLSRWGGAASPDAVKREIDAEIGQLNFWRGRLSTEPVTVYCSNATKRVLSQPGIQAQPKVASDDYRLIQNAITAPYKSLYGIEGARATVEQATRGLLGDLLLGFYDPLTGRFQIPTWFKIGAGGLLALLVINTIRKVAR